MSDKNTNTDNTDEPTKAELHDRVKQLESTVEKLMPSRRDALKLGAAGIAGAAGLSATSQSAEASTGSAGDIGAPNNRPDLFADTVDANSLTGVSTGGILEEDPNSPQSANGSDIQFTMGKSFSLVKIFLAHTDPNAVNFNTLGIRVNGNSTQSYSSVDVSGSTQRNTQSFFIVTNKMTTTGAEISLTLDVNRNRIGYASDVSARGGNHDVSGEFTGTATSIDSFRLFDTSSPSADIGKSVRVFGMNF